MTVEEVLEIDVKPGWKKGTKVTFEEKGMVGRWWLLAQGDACLRH